MFGNQSSNSARLIEALVQGISGNFLTSFLTWSAGKLTNIALGPEQERELAHAFNTALKNALPSELTELNEVSEEIKRLLEHTEKRALIFEIAFNGASLASVQSPHAKELQTISKEADQILSNFVANLSNEIYGRARQPENPLYNLVSLNILQQLQSDLADLKVSKQSDSIRLSDLVQYIATKAEKHLRTLNIPVNPSDFVQRPEIYDQIRGLLLSGAPELTTALEGGGGFGKTTIAQVLCNDEVLQKYFKNQILWMEFGEEPDVLQIINTQIHHVSGEESAQIDIKTAIRQLLDSLKGGRYLLVLDDVWQYAHIKNLVQKPHDWPSEVWQLTFLITTRQKDVIASAGIKSSVIVEQLTQQQAYELLATDIPDTDLAQEALQSLANRYKGWALPLELTNRQLRLHLNRGKSLKQAIVALNKDLDDLGFEGFDITITEERNDAVGKSLDLSLKFLEDNKDRFTTLGIFPEDTSIPLSTLALYWGLDEERAAERLCERFTDLSLAKYDPREKRLRLHDVVRQIMRDRLSDDHRQELHARLIAAWGDPCVLPDDYAWRNYAHHMKAAGKLTELRALLFNFNWLQAKLNATDISNILADCDYFSDDTTVKLLRNAIDLSYHTLNYYKFKDQLGPLLGGRLAIHCDNPDIAALLESGKCPVGIFRSANSDAHDTHGAVVNGILELSDGRVLSWSQDKTLRLWRPDGVVLQTLEGHSNGVSGALELSNRNLLTWSSTHNQSWDDRDLPKENALRLWSPDGRELAVLKDHTDELRGALELSDGRLLSWSVDQTLRIWDQDGGMRAELKEHTGDIRGALELTNKCILSWSDDKTLRLWDANGHPLAVSQEHDDSVTGALELSDGRLLSWADRNIHFWLSDGSLQKVIEAHWMLDIVELPDGNLLASDQDGLMHLFDKNGVKQEVMYGHGDWVIAVLHLKNGCLLSWSYDGTLRFWAGDRKEVGILNHASRVNGAIELAVGHLLSWSSDGTLRIWNAEGRPLAVFCNDSDITCCIVLQDSATIVAGDQVGRVLFLRPAL